MRKVLLIPLILLIPFSSFAQRVNSYGQKVISEILIIHEYEGEELRNNTKKYVYTYSDDLKLKGLKYYYSGFDAREGRIVKDKLQEEFILKDNTLTRKSHVYEYSDMKWEYDFDLYGNIAKITTYSYGSDGSVAKYEYNYTYEYSKEHNWWQMAGSGWTEWYKPKNSKCFYKQELAPYWEYCYIDGIRYDKDTYFKDGVKYFKDEVPQTNIEYRREFFDFDIKNDTNIDLYRIVDRNDIFIGIEATEWNRSRNEYLGKSTWHTYEYIYDNDNLIEIRWGKYTSIYIKYLY